MTIKLNIYEQKMILADIWEIRGDLEDLLKDEKKASKKEKLNAILSTLESVEEAVGF